MPTFIEKLPPRLSSPNSAIQWTPSASVAGGLIAIGTARAYVEYILVPFAPDGPGRAFMLAKTTPGTDATEEAYSVFCSAVHPLNDVCDCKGYTFKSTCKHIDACRALLENRWL